MLDVCTAGGPDSFVNPRFYCLPTAHENGYIFGIVFFQFLHFYYYLALFLSLFKIGFFRPLFSITFEARIHLRLCCPL